VKKDVNLLSIKETEKYGSFAPLRMTIRKQEPRLSFWRESFRPVIVMERRPENLRVGT
jgi:hypothetical protein